MRDFPTVVDNSMMIDFKSCRQKFNLAHGEDWKAKGESVHLHAGKCYAAGLERTRRSFYEGGFSAEDSLAHGARALIETWGDFEPPEGHPKSLDRMLGALEFYFNGDGGAHPGWPLTRGNPRQAEPKLMTSGKYGIEFSFAEPLPYLHPVTLDPIIYCGRSDMIASFAGGTYIEDDKTASQLGESWGRQWELRSQFTGYCWAARKAGIDVNGVLVRGVSILKTKYGAAQVPTYRAGWEIDRWLKQIVRDLGAMEECWREGYWDYDLGEACNHYGGCQFNSVCKSDTPGDWLPMYFERRHWDPLERTETLYPELKGVEE